MFKGMRVQATKNISQVPAGTVGEIDQVLTNWGKGIYTLSVKFEGFDSPVVVGENKVEVIVYTKEERREFKVEREGNRWVKSGTADLMKQLGW